MNNAEKCPAHICAVCQKEKHKYRCPKCLIKYCSLVCYKTHQESLCTPVKQTTDSSKVQSERHSCTAKAESTERSDDESEDRVPAEALERLRENEELKTLLANPHLQQMLSGVDSSPDPRAAMEKAMQEPLFVELADQCLRTIEPLNTGPET